MKMSDHEVLEAFCVVFHTKMRAAVEEILKLTSKEHQQLFPLHLDLLQLDLSAGFYFAQYIINPPGFVEIADILADLD